jgi:hypothetical protein
MPRPRPPVDESHQILLSTLEALRATRSPDGNVHVRYNGGQPLSGQAGGSHLTASGRLEVESRNHCLMNQSWNHCATRQNGLLAGDTGFEPVASSVSVISGTPGNAAVAVSRVRGCPQMIAGCRID